MEISPQTKISLIHADAIKAEVDKKRYGINFCKSSVNFDYFNRLAKRLEYSEVNREMDLAAIVYVGETKYGEELRKEIENFYCPSVIKTIKAL